MVEHVPGCPVCSPPGSIPTAEIVDTTPVSPHVAVFEDSIPGAIRRHVEYEFVPDADVKVMRDCCPCDATHGALGCQGAGCTCSEVA
jgi:hypothetical protein